MSTSGKSISQQQKTSAKTMNNDHKQYTFSYILSPNVELSSMHILAVTKILYFNNGMTTNNNNNILTGGRDGTIINHKSNKAMHIHSDWISDIIQVDLNDSHSPSPYLLFLTTSHDFSIGYLRVNKYDPEDWYFKIIGYHADYVKKIFVIKTNNKNQQQEHDGNVVVFGTIGLDEKLKIWKYTDCIDSTIGNESNNKKHRSHKSTDDNIMAELLCTFDNSTDSVLYSKSNILGSTLSVSNNNNNFSSLYGCCYFKDFNMVVIGDSNGKLKFLRILPAGVSDNGENEVLLQLFYQHDNEKQCNVKFIHELPHRDTTNDSTKMLVVYSTGLFELWNVSNQISLIMRLEAWNWDCSIWCCTDGLDYSDTGTSVVIGDSEGKISLLNIYDNNMLSTELIYQSKYNSNDNDSIINHDHNPGILSLAVDNSNNNLWFSPSNSSDLYYFNLGSNISDTILNGRQIIPQVIRGGHALCKCSLLMNRRHVITENTKGEIQKWDIISCELLEVFPPGCKFDEVVSNCNTKEILPHWCTVSIKTGKLCIRLSPKFLSCEVYGGALSDYDFINDKSIAYQYATTNPKKLISQHQHQQTNQPFILDKDLRYNLGKIVLNSLLYQFVEFEFFKDLKFRKELFNYQQQVQVQQRQGKKKSNNHNSMPNTPVTANSSFISSNNSTDDYFSNKPTGAIMDNNYKNTFEKNAEPLSTEKKKRLSIFTKFTSTSSTPHSTPSTPVFTEAGASIHTNTAMPTKPTSQLPLNSTNSFSNNNNNNNNSSVVNGNSNKTVNSPSYLTRRLKKLSIAGSNYSTDDFSSDLENSLQTLPPQTSGGSSFLPHNDLVNFSSTDMPKNSTHSSDAATANTGTNIRKTEFISDFIKNIYDEYRKAFDNKNGITSGSDSNNSSSGLFNATTSGTNGNSSGNNTSNSGGSSSSNSNGSSSFNKFKLSSKKPMLIESKLSQDYSSPLIKLKSDCLLIVNKKLESGEIVYFSTTRSIPTNIENTIDINTTATNNNDIVNAKVYYENLETHLPYWMSTTLFKDKTGKYVKAYPKLSFIIKEYNPPDTAFNTAVAKTSNKKEESKSKMHYFGFGGGSSSSNANGNNSDSSNVFSDRHDSKNHKGSKLPLISDNNSKLNAPTMIKVKKILLYIVDRFNSKTPEMKQKIPADEWLELLCKGQVLENELTLGSVKTLYWKNSGDIVLEYRRKNRRKVGKK